MLLQLWTPRLPGCGHAASPSAASARGFTCCPRGRTALCPESASSMGVLPSLCLCPNFPLCMRTLVTSEEAPPTPGGLSVTDWIHAALLAPEVTLCRVSSTLRTTRLTPGVRVPPKPSSDTAGWPGTQFSSAPSLGSSTTPYSLRAQPPMTPRFRHQSQVSHCRLS